MPRRPKKHPYEGALASPIVEPLFYSGLDGDPGPILPPHKGPLSNYQAQQRVLAKRSEKLDLLFEYYKIDKRSADRWLKLSILLAMAHVPGMKVIERSRAAKKSFWNEGGYRSLVEDIDGILSNEDLTIPQAIERLKKEKPNPWDNRHSLESRLTEARVFVAEEDAWNKKIQETSDEFTEELRDAMMRKTTT